MDQKMRWDLTPLYTSFESESFHRDMEELDRLIGDMARWTEFRDPGLSPVEVMEGYLVRSNTLRDHLSRLLSFASLTLSVETKNETAQAVMDRIMKKAVELRVPEVRFQRWLKEAGDLDGIISESELLKEHAFILEEMKAKAARILEDREEYLAAKLSNTGGRAWSTLQNLLTANLMVDVEGPDETLRVPLTVARNMAHSRDRKERKAAFLGEMQAYGKIEDASAAALNAIKGEILTLSEIRGYTSPLEMTLEDSRMDRESLEAMLRAVEEALPRFRAYFRAKAKALGYEGGLQFYDLFAPVGESDKDISFDEAKELIVEKFSSFSSALSDFARRAFEENWIDAEPREGKRGGAFCSNLHPIGQSRIMANFSNSLKNVITLAHELGHAYHGHCLKDEKALNAGYPMPLAETASIFSETVVKNALLKGLGSEEKKTILESAVTGYGQIIVDIYSRYLFETELFKRREEASLSVRELKEIMAEAQKKAYGEGLDPDSLHPYMWVNKPHYYMPGRHFYNFPYTFGLLFAKGLYAEYQRQGEAFVPRYDELLRATGRMSVRDVAALVGIETRDEAFWRSSLALIGEEIDTLLTLM
ncbi:MAG TPA: M3 family oligoendopeptidase [Candidatus Mcinerneyibacteriales bacterium]|nr:M3 family oligoendopeptidase [Candidatus Mcinerneyibacteriales bacterium]